MIGSLDLNPQNRQITTPTLSLSDSGSLHGDICAEGKVGCRPPCTAAGGEAAGRRFSTSGPWTAAAAAAAPARCACAVPSGKHGARGPRSPPRAPAPLPRPAPPLARPPGGTYFICFTMVLFPDSPAPVGIEMRWDKRGGGEGGGGGQWGGDRRVLTEQEEFHVFGRADPVLLQVLLDGLAPLQGGSFLSTQGTSHGGDENLKKKKN